jgi:hypothetical protein
MARIAGVTTKKDAGGNITHVTINVKKHKQAIPVLKEMGLMEKTRFEKECEDAITIEEARSHTHEFIRNLPWKK